MIKPIGKRILVKREESKTRTTSGLYLPEQSKETSNKATVVALGVAEDYEFPVAVGDNVLISRYDGTEVSYDDEKYVLISIESVLAVIK